MSDQRKMARPFWLCVVHSPRLTIIDHCMPAVSKIQTIYVMGMNTFTDLYLMAIPLPVG